jgi:hypothetical protein
MAAKMIADATAAAESASGQGELPAAELLPEIKPEIPPEPLVSLIEVELSQAHAMQLAKSHVQAVQAQMYALAVKSVEVPVVLTVSEIKAAFKQAYKPSEEP